MTKPGDLVGAPKDISGLNLDTMLTPEQEKWLAIQIALLRKSNFLILKTTLIDRERENQQFLRSLRDGNGDNMDNPLASLFSCPFVASSSDVNLTSPDVPKEFESNVSKRIAASLPSDDNHPFRPGSKTGVIYDFICQSSGVTVGQIHDFAVKKGLYAPGKKGRGQVSVCVISIRKRGLIEKRKVPVPGGGKTVDTYYPASPLSTHSSSEGGDEGDGGSDDEDDGSDIIDNFHPPPETHPGQGRTEFSSGSKLRIPVCSEDWEKLSLAIIRRNSWKMTLDDLVGSAKSQAPKVGFDISTASSYHIDAMIRRVLASLQERGVIDFVEDVIVRADVSGLATYCPVRKIYNPKKISNDKELEEAITELAVEFPFKYEKLDLVLVFQQRNKVGSGWYFSEEISDDDISIRVLRISSELLVECILEEDDEAKLFLFADYP